MTKDQAARVGQAHFDSKAVLAVCQFDLGGLHRRPSEMKQQPPSESDLSGSPSDASFRGRRQLPDGTWASASVYSGPQVPLEDSIARFDNWLQQSMRHFPTVPPRPHRRPVLSSVI